MVREGRVLISSVTDPDFGASYYVTAYEVGAQVASASAGTSITVRAGHGFAANDKFIVGTDTSTYRTVTVAAATTLTINSAVSVSSGDFLVNLAQDTGALLPNYDGAGLTVYTDMDYSNAATNNTVQCDANGKYRYYHTGIARWELVRSSLTVPFALYQDAVGSVNGADSSTDNAVVRWDGTSGENIQNSVVIISDAGAVTGVTDLTTSGDVVVGDDLTITGDVAVTLTATVTGVSTLTGGIAGGIPRNAGTWSITAVSNGTSTTPNVANVYVGSVFLGANATVTGIQYMRGSAAAGAEKVIVALYNKLGAAVANSATAGTGVGTASQTHQVAFTATYAAVGPAWYFVGVFFDTATAALFQTIPAFCNCGNGVIGNAIGSQTFGTVATITPPTTFTADTVPVASLY